VLGVERSYYGTDGKPWSPRPLKEGEALIVRVTVTADTTMPDALLTDLLPAGLEIENFNLGDAKQWADVVVDGITISDRGEAADTKHEEFRDDRYVAALKLSRGSKANVFYLVRAVTRVPTRCRRRWWRTCTGRSCAASAAATRPRSRWYSRDRADGPRRRGPSCWQPAMNNTMTTRLAALRRRLQPLWPWLRWGTAATLALLLVLDFAFPPPLPKQRDTSTLVVAADGTPLRAFADAEGVWRYPASIDSVSPLYLQALLTYEDRWFWRHPGINPLAILRASGQLLRGGRIVSGGSTLTMQVARILDPHTRTPWGKLKQMLRAVQLEVHLSKQQILALYLERAPYGGTIEGVEAASWAYLGKPAAQLSHAEAALLAVLPQAPSRLRPDRHPEAAQKARDKVLSRMAELGAWTRKKWKMRASRTWSRARCGRRCMPRCWHSACTRRIRARHASRAASTSACSARWKNAWPAISRRCPSAPRRPCWWSTTRPCRRVPMSARWRSVTASGSATWTWCRPGGRRAPRSSRSCMPWRWTMA
jgi:hypothetical protein